MQNFSLRFFGIKTETLNSSLISSKWRNYQRGVLLIHAGAIERRYILKEKRRGKVTEVGLVLARQCPSSPGTCNPKETGLPGLPMSWSLTLFSGSSPVGLTSVAWTEKIVRPLFFARRGGHCSRGDLVRRTNFRNFFDWPAKFRTTGSELYWALCGVCWISTEFGRWILSPSCAG